MSRFFEVCSLRRTWLPPFHRCGPLKNVLLSEEQIAAMQECGAGICTASEPDVEFDLQAAIEEAEREENPGAGEPEPEPEDPGILDEAALIAAFAAAADVPEITLGADITLTAKLYARTALTLNLNGKTLSGPTDAAYLLASGMAAHLNIVGEGRITTPIQASSNATVTLNEGVTVETSYTASLVGSSATLNIKGATIRNSAKNGIQAQSQSTVVVDGGLVDANENAVKALSGSTIELRNGELVGKTGGIYVSDTNPRGTGGATISGGSVRSDTYGITLFDDAHLTVMGGEVSAAAAILTNGSAVPSNKDVKVDLTGGNITGTVAGIYMPAGTLNAHNGTTITGPAGIVMRGGILKVDGGMINATSNTTVKVGDTKYDVPAAAISVDANANYNSGNVDVTVTGGIINALSEADKAISYTENGEPKDTDAPNGIKIDGATIRGTVPTKAEPAAAPAAEESEQSQAQSDEVTAEDTAAVPAEEAAEAPAET